MNFHTFSFNVFWLLLLIICCACHHKASAFILANSNIKESASSNPASSWPEFSRRQPGDKIIRTTNILKRVTSLTRLSDSPDGNNKLDSLQNLSNVTVTRDVNENARYEAYLRNRSATWTRHFDDYANAAAGTLGDIMSRGNEDMDGTTSHQSRSDGSLSSLDQKGDGLVTTAIPSGTLASRFGIDHPLDRMALTANGNLQRLVSSYYDAPVQVLVDSCDLVGGRLRSPKSFLPVVSRPPNSFPKVNRWDRVVHLTVHNQTFCTAHSVITVFDPICQELVESGQIGIGQLFRYLDILPEFELHNAGPYPIEEGGGFWREYTLRCAELSCEIREDFRSEMWEIQTLPASST